jgi:hypothetical protein
MIKIMMMVSQAIETGVAGAMRDMLMRNDNTVDGAAVATTTTATDGSYSSRPATYIVGVTPILQVMQQQQQPNGGDPDVANN